MQTPSSGVKNESRKRKLFRRFIWIAAVIAACFSPTLTFAQTNSTWNGGTGNWSTATDWTPNGAPDNGGGTTYNVTIDSGSTDTVTLDQNATVNSLVLGGAFTGSTYTSTLQDQSGTAETLNITGSLTVNETGSLTFNNGSGLAVGGNFSSAGYVDLEGGGSLSVSGNLTNSGELYTNYPNQIMGSNTITVTGTLTNDSIFDLGGYYANKTSDVANVGTLVNHGYLVVATGATLDLTNQPNGITDLVAGSAILLSGTIKAGANNGLVNVASIEGVLDLENGQSLTLTPTTLTIGSIGGLNLENASSLTVTNLTNSGTVSNGDIAGTHRNTLTVTSTFINNAGATFYMGSPGGTSNDVANIGMLVNNGNVFVGYGATLDLTNQPNGITDVVQGSSLTLKGTLIAGTNDGLANLNSIEGTLSLQNLQTTTVTASSGTLTVSNTGNLTVTFGSTDLKVIGNVNNAGKLTISTGNTFTIDGTNGYMQTAGTANVNGTLYVMSPGGVSVSGGTILDSGLINTGSFTQTAGTTTVKGSLSVASSGGVSVSGGSVVDTGIITAGSFTQTAGTTMVKGTLSIASSGDVNVSGGTILDTGKITTGSYTQTAGATTVNGSLAATSPSGVNVSGGSVFGIGTITGNIDLIGGLLSPGAASKKAGELTVSGTYTQSGAGAFDVDLGGTTAGTQYDVLNITSTVALGGVLNVDLISGFKPTVGESFDIMDYTSETGTFTTLNLPRLTGGDTWAISYNATDVVLTVEAPAAAGQSAVSVSPASTHQPTAILSKATCFAAHLLGSESCGVGSVAKVPNGGEIHTASVGGGAVHNNIMVVSRSTPAARGGVLLESSASATAMARLYACAYLPASVGHTMGCN